MAGEPEEGFVHLGARRLHYVLRRAEDGSPAATNAPLVFLHEGLGSIGLWRGLPEHIADALGGRTTLVFSRHGYGHSSVAVEPYDVGFLETEAREVLPQLVTHFELPPPILVGHSDGASIALIYAASGFRVRGLVLIAPHTFVEACTLGEIRKVGEQFERTDLAQRMTRHHANAVATFRRWHDAWLDPEFERWNITSSLAAIEAPTLVIQGSDDPFGTLAQVRAIELGVTGQYKQVVFEGCGHAPHLEERERCETEIVQFVRDVT